MKLCLDLGYEINHFRVVDFIHKVERQVVLCKNYDHDLKEEYIEENKVDYLINLTKELSSKQKHSIKNKKKYLDELINKGEFNLITSDEYILLDKIFSLNYPVYYKEKNMDKTLELYIAFKELHKILK